MVFTKYAVVSARLRDGEQEESFNVSVLSYALQDDLDCTIYDTENEAMDAIMEDGFNDHTYIVPMIVDTASIHQVKLSLDSAFK